MHVFVMKSEKIISTDGVENSGRCIIMQRLKKIAVTRIKLVVQRLEYINLMESCLNLPCQNQQEMCLSTLLCACSN